MSEYYDHYHRWEPLAEFHFNLESDDDEYDEENYLYCLCSRAFIRDGVKTYYVDKEASESDAEIPKDNQSQPGDDHSHVHFSIDTSYKVKCEKDEGASCYCSASHTDNCCSTDEHDGNHIHGLSHALQPSDSGADLTYQDCHSDCTNHDKRMDQYTEENYLSEDTWDKFWAVNGERLIWASWIKKYSDYINPQYLDENNDLLLDDNKLPKQRSVDQIYSESEKAEDDSMRERKFSYDSKVNPYKKATVNTVQIEKENRNENKDESWLPVNRTRSCSEHERIVSPRTIEGTDSMTNVTKITMSSYDITSSHITSESTPTDDFSVSSTTSDDQSNDQTRIANIENLDPDNIDEMDTDQYWQFLWKKHFGDQYALHYANYIEMFNKQNVPSINIEIVTDETDLKDTQSIEFDENKVTENDKVLDIDCENSEGNSQEQPTVVEVKNVVNQIEQINISEGTEKPKNRKRNKKTTAKYLGSVGVLLQNLLKDEQNNVANEADFTNTEVNEAGDSKTEKKENQTPTTEKTHNISHSQNIGSSSLTSYSYDDGDDEPPDETPVNLKRSHEIDQEVNVADKIKTTFDIMGFCATDKLPKGSMVYRKRASRLRPPRYKKFGAQRKTYFDEDGNPVQDQEKDSQDEREMQTDEDCPDFRTQAIKLLNSIEPSENEKQSIDESLPSDNMSSNMLKNDCLDTLDDSVSYDVTNNVDGIESGDNGLVEASEVALPDDAEFGVKAETAVESVQTAATSQESAKRRRRQKRQAKVQESVLASMPAELRDEPRMMKYWKKRHSLFHRFDEGIRLDRESWFSVTPENVARHIACKYTYDTVLDAFCGAGGNTLQFANTCKKVIAIDIDPAKIAMARHNAAVYGVAERVEFIVGDFFELAHTLEADMVFLSPPWGGPEYSQSAEYDIETMLQPRPASELMSVARTISPTVYLYLPRNSKTDQILSLAKEVGGSVEIEQSFLDRRFVAITAYFY